MVSCADQSEKIMSCERSHQSLRLACVRFILFLRVTECCRNGSNQVSGQSNDGLAAEVEKFQTVFNQQKAASDALSERLGALRGELARLDTALGELTTRLGTNKQQREEKELEQKKVTHKVQQLQKDDKEVHLVVARLEKEHTWIEKKKNFFGKAGTDFDFEANSYPDNKKGHDDLQTKQKTLGKSINKKAMAMYEKAEQDLWIDSLLCWNHCARVVVSFLSRFVHVVFHRFGPTICLSVLFGICHVRKGSVDQTFSN